MNENLENQLAKVVEKSLSIAEKTGEFVIEQAPDLLREFYAWHITSSALGVLLGVFLMILGFNIFKLWTNKYKEGEKVDYMYSVFMGRIGESLSIYMPFVFLNLFGIIILCFNLFSLLKILIAPKIYLIEYFIR